MQVEVYNYAQGLELFIPGARFGQKFQVEVPPDAKVKDVLAKLGIPLNVFAVLVNGHHATIETPCHPNDCIYLLEALQGG